LPELIPTTIGFDEGAKAEDILSPCRGPAHAGAAQALFDQGFAGGFGDARADGIACSSIAPIIHLVQVIGKIGDGGLKLFVRLGLQGLGGVHHLLHVTQQVFGGMALVLEIMTRFVKPRFINPSGSMFSFMRRI
jgi:hypothetical protein